MYPCTCVSVGLPALKQGSGRHFLKWKGYPSVFILGEQKKCIFIFPRRVGDVLTYLSLSLSPTLVLECQLEKFTLYSAEKTNSLKKLPFLSFNIKNESTTTM